LALAALILVASPVLLLGGTWTFLVTRSAPLRLAQAELREETTRPDGTVFVRTAEKSRAREA
jgi:hypothetical protein